MKTYEVPLKEGWSLHEVFKALAAPEKFNRKIYLAKDQKLTLIVNE